MENLEEKDILSQDELEALKGGVSAVAEISQPGLQGWSNCCNKTGVNPTGVNPNFFEQMK